MARACSSTALILAAIGLAGCARDRSEQPAGANRPGLAAVGSVAGAATFDLVNTPGGALLVWAPARADGGGIMQRELDPLGVPRAAARRVVARSGAFEIVEVAAASSPTDHGIVWVESDGSGARTRALLVPVDGAPPPAAIALAS